MHLGPVLSPVLQVQQENSGPVWNSSPPTVMDIRAEALPTVSDAELIHDFQRTRDGQYFATLFVRHRRQVFCACHAFFSDVGIAEDATQEAFMRAYRNVSQFREGDFAAWLNRIARNVCIDYWRHRRPEQERDSSELEERSACGNQPDSFELRLAATQVLEEMQLLPAEQRRCLELKIEGYSYGEIAERLGLSLGAVKSHLQNGRRMLWLKLEGRLA
jgi:RNA polymerase sigma-70 factor, ECF subfamily